MFSECPDGVNGQLLLLRQQCGRYMALSKVSEPLFRRSPDRHVLAAQSPLTLTIWPLRSRHRRMLTLCSVRPSRWAASRIGTSMINPSSSGVHLRRLLPGHTASGPRGLVGYAPGFAAVG